MSFATGSRRLVVVGAEGFIGSALVREALAAGGAVTGVCVKPAWRLDGIEDPDLALTQVPDGRWWGADYRPALEAMLEGADALALLAYEPPAGDGDARLAHELEVNTRGIVEIGRIAARLGVHVVFTSSADVYGPWHAEPVDEQLTPQPATPYAFAKLLAETRLLAASDERWSVLCLRLSTVFGPGEHAGRAIPSFIRHLASGTPPVVHGDGRDVRDYLSVADAAQGILAACERAGTAGTVNLGSGTGRSTLEVLEAVAAAMGVSPDPRFEPSPRPESRLVLDTGLASRLLDFAPRVDFEAGLAEEIHGMAGAVA